MIRLFKVKEKQRELAENASGGVPIKKQSAGELRLHKGFLLVIIYVFPFVSVLSWISWSGTPLNLLESLKFVY